MEHESVLRCLLYDNPYDLYWYYKNRKREDGGAMSIGVGSSVDPNTKTQTITSISFILQVYPAYKDTESTDDAPVVTSDVSLATKAVQNAAKIVADNASKSDWEKLKSYKEAICNLTSYNDAAAKDDYLDDPGNPWQLIWALYGNDATQVVCEGYSKAFKYLCDLSTFD